MRLGSLALAALTLLLLSCRPTGKVDVRVWERFEATLPIAVVASNPFDPAQADVRVEFRDPDGSVVTTPGFVYRAYERTLAGGTEQLSEAGPLEWRVRFTPTAAGRWHWRWLRTLGSNEPEVGAWQPLQVGPNLDKERHGFVRRSPHDDRYLAFDDGAPFFAVGENLSWADGRGTFAYDAWFARLAAEGVNYVRLWMPSWGFGLDYAPAELGNYTERLDRAWQLDYVLEQAEAHGIHVMLSVQNHGPFDLDDFFGSGWPTNLYNAENGGPLAHPSEFWGDEDARRFFRRYLRYVAARWGYATNLLAWELLNEGNLPSQPPSFQTMVDWHREMAATLTSHDPNDHLVTTSSSQGELVVGFWLTGRVGSNLPFRPVWELPEIDFAQIHAYQIATIGVATSVHTMFPPLVATLRAFGKPVLIGETGVDFQGPAETLSVDPDGDGFHDALWAGVFSESFGTGMSWWWDNVVDPEDRYFHFGPVAELVAGVAFDREAFVAVVGGAASPTRELAAHALAGDRTLLAWIRNAAHEYYTPDATSVEGGTFELPPLPPGSWRGSWRHTTIRGPAGELGKVELESNAAGDPIVLTIPSFSKDIALRLELAES